MMYKKMPPIYCIILALIISSCSFSTDLKDYIQQRQGEKVSLPDEMADVLTNDPRLSTLLLNKNHEIVAIGNPILSSSINKLYKSIISGQQTFNNSWDISMIINDNSYDFGNTPSCGSIYHTFTLVNKSSDTVIIHNVVSSCDCIETEILQSKILPKDSTLLTVKLTLDSLQGEFYRTVHIFYKGIDYPNIIEITGTITANNNHNI